MDMTNIKTETYRIDGKWLVDIQTKDDTYYAYLWHERYGIKDLMFGCPVKQQSYEEFISLVEANFEDYKDIYIDEFMDEEDEG